MAVGEQPDTVEEVCEPFLVRAGLLARTPAGPGRDRRRAWRHLGPDPADGAGLPAVRPAADLFVRRRNVSA